MKQRDSTKETQLTESIVPLCKRLKIKIYDSNISRLYDLNQ